MAKKINKNKQVSLRISSEIHSELTTYANTHSLSLTDACVRLIEKGLEYVNKTPATKDDIEQLIAETNALKLQQENARVLLLDAIKNQPIAIQQTLPPSEEENQAKTKKRGLLQRLFND